ncbi:bifunctional tRNA (adenosine(37)-N6)-threonylcarbamoyltransferase complex dimerization subunit type 1 TsaB/ribosomal protein alanine acetyltransferase RimI [Bordetella sp. FB-8]|uniref:bifunctional tRNA (adenosine(37)-N6)-threonylcarbamoyltransferase complex dimerization subunit type 1 TsaB/ribosomal protein alanine acetyltransferase RimI n=1 Tax=Bordetella sp. FB-8 TaxID=1159870 RepID=UPI0006864F5F|nr:bifunctional tRNA (adenosine(37)-N6)-threonylcarbamoyltransferase complex dimerization subunit type 1 TsaB/ribosomal protein alanine acetyltransferase RimI [Bordetella sp. FB-8]
MKLNLLAFETSSSRCGVALLCDAGSGSPEVVQLEHEGTQDHAERLLPMASQLLARAGLAPADLDAVAFGQGPGGFTGLRVACGVAQGVALGLGVPVLPVVSHLAVAQDAQAGPDDAVLVALDARMSEVYLAAYVPEPDLAGTPIWRVLQAPMLISAEEVLPWARHQLPVWSREAGRALSLRLAGDAWQAYPEAMPAAGLQHAHIGRPRAATVARLARNDWLRGAALPPEEAAPLYVRDKVAFTMAERAGGQGGNPRAGRALPEHEDILQAMTRDDLDAVTALEAQAQAFPWTRGNFEDALKAGYPACVLRHGTELGGFCVLMPAPDVVHLLVIAVAGDLRRRGLGRRLVDWCLAWAEQSGAQGILLEVRPSNQNARRFYERLGFRQIGLRKGYYPAAFGREDALVLCRDAMAQGPGGASARDAAVPVAGGA